MAFENIPKPKKKSNGMIVNNSTADLQIAHQQFYISMITVSHPWAISKVSCEMIERGRKLLVVKFDKITS